MAGRFKPAPAGGYLEMPLGDFLDEVASPRLVPGAGYTSAVAVAMAAGLVAMASRRSVGVWPEGGGAAAQAETLRKRVVPLAQQNIDAYLEAVAALDRSTSDAPAGSGASPQEGSAGGSRDDEIARALERAAEIPLQIGEVAADVAALAAEVAEFGEPGVRADAAAAGALALAGARGAAVLVEVNLTTTASDDRVARARAFVAGAEAAVERAAAVVG